MGSVCAGRGVFYGTDPFESRAPDQRFDSAGAFWKFVLRLLRGAQHYCARNEFFCTFDAAWLYTPFMEDVGAVYLPAVVPAVLSAGVTMVLLAKQITRLLERHYSVVFHGIIGIVLAATLVIVPFSAFGNPKTSAVSLLCLTAGAGTALLFSMLEER